MKLPGRMLDLSSPLENETVYDPPFMRPKIQYLSGVENAPMLLDSFPGLKREDLPDGEGWAFEIVTLTTHNGTHMDAPVHYQSKTIDGERMKTIDEIPPVDRTGEPGRIMPPESEFSKLGRRRKLGCGGATGPGRHFSVSTQTPFQSSGGGDSRK